MDLEAFADYKVLPASVKVLLKQNKMSFAAAEELYIRAQDSEEKSVENQSSWKHSSKGS